MGEKRQQQKEKKKPLTKVIIRQLPPTMTEEEFLKQIDPLPEHDDYYFVPPDWSLGLEATCRAYINFTNPEDVFLFQERFDGYVFLDNKGSEYLAQVEYAPFQGFAKSRSKKKDIKANSIETDVHYLEFVERFNNQENDMVKGDLKVEFNLNAKKDNQLQSTPLLEYLQDKKDARREERKRRNDERKERRDKERQQKKILVAKNIPPSIKEEGAVGGLSESKAEPKEGNSSKSEEKPKEGSRRDRYEEKRIQRKREKDAKRRERRDQKRAEERRGSKESVESTIAKKVEELSLNDVPGERKDEAIDPTPKESAEQTEKKAEKRDDRRGERRERKEERERRIRNKDRPDIQIYQPGKLRVNPSEEGGSTASTAASGTKKRVSRYSEKRRAKESGTTGAPLKEETEQPPENL